MLTPTEIGAEISRSLDFLETDLRDVPVRQRSMRAVFDHSWRLLSEREQAEGYALACRTYPESDLTLRVVGPPLKAGAGSGKTSQQAAG